MPVLLFVAGLLLLIVGAELLVRGASRLAASFGIPSLAIGLTVVAFGTSAPEMAVSLKSALAGEGSIAVGNAIGSNIFNTLFILGLSAVICPLLVSVKLIRWDVPLMIAATVVVLALAADGEFSRVEGIGLMLSLALYTAMQLIQGRKETGLGDAERVPPGSAGWARRLGQVVLVAVGLAMLVVGSRWLVQSAVTVAEVLGVSQLVIGLTIVAAGTSLPEVVTSVVAALRGERDIAVGNVVGSNLFNLLGVLGLGATAAPAGVPVAPSVIAFDLPVLLAVSIACLPVFITGGVISRWEGAVLLGFYIAYTAYLVLTAGRVQSFSWFSTPMVWFVIPLLVVTAIVIVLQSRQRDRRAAEPV